MSNRIKIVNSEIQKAISQIITYELNNPKITGIITVTNVDTTTDFESSKIYLSIFTAGDKMEVFNSIKHSATFIRKELAKKIKIRHVPFLEFILDNSIEINEQMGKIIDDVMLNN